jgi:hypothetical protein
MQIIAWTRPLLSRRKKKASTIQQETGGILEASHEAVETKHGERNSNVKERPAT